MKNFILFFTIALVISSCASIPKQSFNASANSSIKKIAVLSPPAIEEIPVVIRQHPGESFGLIGGLIAISDMKMKTSTYNNALESTKIDWSVYAQQQLIAEIQKVGYEASPIAIRQKGDNGYLPNYPANNADALLDFIFFPSQIAAGLTTGYVPTVNLSVRLVDAKDKKILYEESFVSGLPSSREIVTFPANKEFKDIDELVAGTQASTDELKHGISQIAQRIAHDLKKQTNDGKN